MITAPLTVLDAHTQAAIHDGWLIQIDGMGGSVTLDPAAFKALVSYVMRHGGKLFK